MTVGLRFTWYGNRRRDARGYGPRQFDGFVIGRVALLARLTATPPVWITVDQQLDPHYRRDGQGAL